MSWIESPHDILAIGCETCKKGNGQIHFYVAENLKHIVSLTGDNDYQKIGRNLVFRKNTGFADQFFYESHKDNEITLNSIIFFKRVEEIDYEYKEEKDLLTV